MEVKLSEIMNLSGKIAVVTGGAGHLGKSISQVLAELGATVIIATRSLEKASCFSKRLSREYSVESGAVVADISNMDSVANAVENIKKNYGRIDVWINNSYFGAGKDILSMTEEEWLKGIDGTINGVFRCTKAVLPVMLEQKKGNIINISSMYGIVSPDFSVYKGNEYYNPPNYGSGKAAIIQFTKYIACAYGSKGIRCNCISPGPFPNEHVKKSVSFIRKLSNKVPIGRIGYPYELKGVVALLATEASSFLNGANIVVDGGWTAW